MAEYIENVNGTDLGQNLKLDWAQPFQRTGAFPLDRSALFSSLTDAQAYATGEAVDSRKLGGASYVGQIIAVYEAAIEENKDEGIEAKAASVNAYLIGQDRQLVKLAATTASGDLAADIVALQGQVSTLNNRVGYGGDEPTGLFKEIEEIWNHPENKGIGARKDDETNTEASGLWGAVEALESRATALESKEDKDTTYSVAESDKVLKLTGTEFSTELGLKHENGKISLTGINGEVIAEFSDADFIADGVLEDVSYNAETKELTFTWNVLGENGQKKTDVVDISDLIDTYTAGNGIDIIDAVVSVKIKANEKYLKADVNGLYTEGIDEAIAKAIEELPKEDNNTTYTIGTEDSEKKVKVILTPDEGEAQQIEVNVYNTTALDKMLYEGSYDKDGESIPSNVAEADRSKARLITPDEIKKLSVLELGEGGVEISGNVNANNVTGLGQAIVDKVTGAVDNGGLGIAPGAQVNIIEEIQVNNSPVAINDKKVNITVPTALSQLTDDKNYLTNVKVKNSTADGEGNVTYEAWLKVEQSTADVRVIDDSRIQSEVKTAKERANEAWTLADEAYDYADQAYELADKAIVGVKIGDATLAVDSDKIAHIDGLNFRNALGLGDLAYRDSIDTGVHSVELIPGITEGTLRLKVDGVAYEDIKVNSINTMAYQPMENYLTENVIAGIIGFTGELRPGTNNRPSVLNEIKNLKKEIGNVSNIMNFRGVVEATNDNFNEDVKAIENPKDGDVILYKEQEYVYSGTDWVLFGEASANAAAIAALNERIDTVINTTIPGAITNELTDYQVKSVVSGHEALIVSNENGQITIGFADEIILNGGKADIESTT